MQIIISNISSIPIYEQIKNQVIEQIIDETLTVDDKLPSIRQLAKDIKVSVITTTRAYKELEEEGYITSVPGKGFFVLPKNDTLSRELRMSHMENLLSEALHIKAELHLSEAEFIEILTILEQESSNE